MRRITVFIVLLIVGFTSCMEKQQQATKPKIVVGMVIDQMRWDYLYRYYDLYGNDGFKRLLRGGYNCQNTMLNYLPSFTAPGHTCIYTGSVPSITGIAGNNWIDNKTGKPWYCVDDPNVHLAGDTSKAPSMSPNNLLTTTITDELRLATNFKSRVYGVAIKDRGSIIPAGHLGNAAYWYDDRTGNFTTSTYYPSPQQNPKWLQAFNKRHPGDSMTKEGWKLLLFPKYYDQSTTDANNYEGNFKGEKAPVFPHKFDTLQDVDRYKIVKTLPAGNTYTLMMAEACIEGEHIGLGDPVDFMAVSLSSTDYAGHQFGPNSIELEDMYLRLDRDIANFLKYLDQRYGYNNYLFFLTADHGGAHNATFLTDMDVPAGVESAGLYDNLNTYLKAQFGKDTIVLGLDNYQIYLNNSYFDDSKTSEAKPEPTPAQYKEVRIKGRHGRYKTVKVKEQAETPKATAGKLDRKEVKKAIMEWFGNRPEVQYVIDMENINKAALPEPIRTMAINGYYKPRSGDIQIILNPGWFDNGGRTTGMTHGSWNPYDTHIPLLWYGWNIPCGETHREIHMTDITATLAALLNIQEPNGCIGQPITEITDNKHKK
jgi:predicted AlkP superfamily pyrophosphatase or phosphodiesterase